MDSYYEQQTGEIFKSTVVYPNRKENKQEITEKFRGILIESGNPVSLFYSKAGILLAKGHIRMVYGDHGPYIEFLPANMVRSSWKTIRRGVGWYDECQPKDGSYCKLYVQTKSVHMLKKPPKGANSCYNNRYDIDEGYADYRVGRLYINPFELGSVSVISSNIIPMSLKEINQRLKNEG